MLGIYFGTISLFLTLRQFVIGYYKKWSIATCLYFVFFTVLSLLLARQAIRSFDITRFSLLSAALTLWISYDIYKLKNSTFTFSYLRWIFGCIFSLLALLFLTCVALPHLYTTQEVLHIEMTAEEKKEVITWKNIHSPLKTEILSLHRVIIKDIQGHVLFDDYILGDLVSVKMKILNLPRGLKWMGFPNLWSLESISSDYAKQQHQFLYPHHTYWIESTHNIFKKILWGFWEKTFYFEARPFFISSTSMSSTHFPIINRKGVPIKGLYKVVLNAHASAPYVAQVEPLESMPERP